MRQPHVQTSGAEIVEQCILLDCSTLHVHAPQACGVLHTHSRMSAAFFELHERLFQKPTADQTLVALRRHRSNFSIMTASCLSEILRAKHTHRGRRAHRRIHPF